VSTELLTLKVFGMAGNQHKLFLEIGLYEVARNRTLPVVWAAAESRENGAKSGVQAQQ
jgi:hypothetical protein